MELLNRIRYFDIFPTAYLLYCAASIIAAPVKAASVPGYVIGWGDDASGKVMGISSIPFSNGAFIVTANAFDTGTVRIAGQLLSNAVAISAGFAHSLAIRDDGTVVAWGYNNFGQTTVPAGLTAVF